MAQGMCLRNVGFALSPTDYSVLGADFLEHFMLEHNMVLYFINARILFQ